VCGTATLLAVYAAAGWSEYDLMADGASPSRILTIGIALTSVCYGCVGLELRGRCRVPRALVQLGDSSYSLYLTHIATIKVVGSLMLAAGVSGAIARVTVAGATVTLCALVGLGHALLVERPLLRMVRDRSRVRDRGGKDRRARIAESEPARVRSTGT
jgi:peptidoglycan/LPS O-acetylase OafA/YrhL